LVSRGTLRSRLLRSKRDVIDVTEIPVDRLVAIIAMQNAIARTPAGLDRVMAVVVERASTLTGASGAVVELVDGDAMLYRAACGLASSFVGLRLARNGSLSGRCIAERTALYAADTSTDERVDRAACQRVGAASNRRAFDRQLVQEIARSTRHRHPLSVAMFDLDGLKAANDTLGHAAGDSILRDAANLLFRTLRVHDGCFRIGGDEFAAILPETTEDNARHAVRRCVTSVVDARLGDGLVGVSAGVAEILPGETPIALVDRADTELYANKRSNHAKRSGPIKTIRRTGRLRRVR
jgi:diguanylate cyclase (GGDEF)-like protein